MKLYLGCALKGAPKEFVDQVLNLRSRLEAAGIEILRFVDLDGRQPTDTEIFEWDMFQVARCDAILAICDEPSFGLGFEVATALQLGKRVLMVAHRTRVISAFPPGVNLPGAVFIRYESLDDVLDLVRAHLMT